MTKPGSTLALTPGSREQQLTLPGAGANTEPTRHFTPSTLATDTALTRAGEGYYDWLDHIWPAAGCQHPIRLYGEMATVDIRTGEICGSVPTTTMPDGVIYKACGNRRSSVCPSCADTYRRDAYQLIRSGLTGGKTIPRHRHHSPGRLRDLHRTHLRRSPHPPHPKPHLP